MERLRLKLWNPQQAHQEFGKAWALAKSLLMAGHTLMLTVQPVNKSRQQEEKYHAMIGEVAEQATHLGSKWGAEDWKRLLLDKFARETGRTHGRIIPNLDSSGVVEVGVLSRKFSVKDANEFIEWLYAWGTENGILFEDSLIDLETGEISHA